MDRAFWEKIARYWRITLNEEEIEQLKEKTSEAAESWAKAKITAPYSRNPLDDEDFDDDDF